MNPLPVEPDKERTTEKNEFDVEHLRAIIIGIIIVLVTNASHFPTWFMEMLQHFPEYFFYEFTKLKDERIKYSEEEKDAFIDYSYSGTKEEIKSNIDSYRGRLKRIFEENYKDLNISEKKLSIFIEDIFSEAQELPKIYPKKEMTLSEDEDINALLSLKLHFVDAFFNQVIDFFVKTNSQLISNRQQAINHLYDHYSSSLLMPGLRLNLFSNFIFSEHKLIISKKTSDRYAKFFLGILAERMDTHSNKPIAKKWTKVKSAEVDLTGKQITLLIHYLRKYKLIGNRPNLQLGEIFELLTGYNVEDLRKLGAKNIEVILQSQSEDKIEFGNALKIIGKLEEVIEGIKHDLEQSGYIK